MSPFTAALLATSLAACSSTGVEGSLAVADFAAPSFCNAVASVGAAPIRLVVDRVETIDTSAACAGGMLRVPANVELSFERQGRLTTVGGARLAIAGAIAGEPTSIFDSASAIELTGSLGRVAQAEWWDSEGGDDAPALNAAIDALEATGGVLQLAERVYHLQSSGLKVNGPVSIEGRGRTSVLQIDTSAYPENKVVYVESTTSSIHEFYGDLAAGQRTLDFVTNAEALAPGDEVMVLAGIDPYDPTEEFLRMFNTVESENGQRVTLVRPIDEAVASCLPLYCQPNQLRKLGRIVDGTYYRNFALDYVPGQIPDQGITLQWTRNVVIEGITSRNLPGSFADIRESENVTVRHLMANRLQAIHPATRLIGGWGFRHCTFEDIVGRDVEGPGVFFESQVRGAVVNGLSISSSGGSPTIPLVHIAGGSIGIAIGDYRFSSAVDRIAANVVQESQLSTHDVYLQAGTLAFPLEGHSGNLFYDGTGKLYTATWTSRVVDFIRTADVPLPSGIYKDVHVRVSSTAGIQEFWIIIPDGSAGTNIAPQLRAGEWVQAPFTMRGVGSGYPFNDVEKKIARVITGQGVPPGATFEIEIVYMPPP